MLSLLLLPSFFTYHCNFSIVVIMVLAVAIGLEALRSFEGLGLETCQV